MSPRLLNYILYQAGWFACVLGAAWGYAAAGTCIGLLTLALHFGLAQHRRAELELALAAAAIGLCVDTTQIWLGTLHFGAGTVVAWLPPPWMVVIWMQFATTFHYSLRWLQHRPLRAALFGAVGGPLAFWAGRRLGVVELHPDLWPSLLSLAVLWSVAMPLSVWLAEHQAQGEGEYRWPA
jgi:hypothetical protein